MPSQLTHLDENNQARMVDVSEKNITARTALAESTVLLPPEVAAEISGNEIQSKKGPVFQTAIIAGTMAVKKTADLIPLCHPLLLEKIHFDIQSDAENKTITIQCSVKMSGKTGVEMEALTGASVAALTIYDMCKALSKNIVISQTKLIEKTGGKSDYAG